MILTWPRILPPGVDEVRGVVGVPVQPLASGWAPWLAVDLDAPPLPRAMTGRRRSRWRPAGPAGRLSRPHVTMRAGAAMPAEAESPAG